MKPRESWDDYYMRIAEDVATRSKDRSSQIGAVIVGPDKEIRSTGYNGFARGVNDEPDERHERPTKYLLTPHAEINAITNAARVGVPTKGCKVYVAGPLPCCSYCAACIIDAGIEEVIVKTMDAPDRDGWKENCGWAKVQFEEAGVVVRMPNCEANGEQR